MGRLFFFFCFSILVASTTVSGQSIERTPEDRYSIIPRPARLEPQSGDFILSQTTLVVVPIQQTTLKAIADDFVRQVNLTSGLTLATRTAGQLPLSGQVISFLPVQDTLLGNEGYRLAITPTRVTIEANQPSGFFYAIQTLYQLLPPAVLGTKPVTPTLNWTLPACRITDWPRYAYRGLHLDVSRHVFPVSFIKKYLDLMALHKLNNFHWHLTDDQGWRIEIKKFPRLTQIGSRRRETLVGHYNDTDPQVFDGKPYGGFYAQTDIREVVRYAQTKYINVIPEIELPGHSLAALAAYPDLGCQGGSYQTATTWGVFNNVFCPTETTFSFLQAVLSEVMALFPSPYIHIGGDECPKSTWRRSAFCRRLMKQQGLKTMQQLQSYFIRRIDKFVTARGRKIIGWDEILEGGLSPNATVMSWRGIKGGIEAARQHHSVIMTPGNFCYFDHYQADPGQEPTAFGGYLPLSQVYAYDPTPTELSAAEAQYILGAQGNVWTEYLSTPESVEYMVWPRAAALAEITWTPAERKDYADFSRRLPAQFARLKQLNVNYARSFYDVTTTVQPASGGRVTVSLMAGPEVNDIRYTLDGSPPSGASLRYESPITLAQSTVVKATAFTDRQPLGKTKQRDVLISKATGKAYTLLNPPNTTRLDRNLSLTNGITGSMGGYELNDVVLFKGVDFSAVIDLDLRQPVQTVTLGIVKYTARNMCLPRAVTIDVSDDGKTFVPAQTRLLNSAEGGKRSIERIRLSFPPTQARYVRVTALNAGKVARGLRNPGATAQLAIDEITVD